MPMPKGVNLSGSVRFDLIYYDPKFISYVKKSPCVFCLPFQANKITHGIGRIIKVFVQFKMSIAQWTCGVCRAGLLAMLID
jgi:hypothetical protein